MTYRYIISSNNSEDYYSKKHVFQSINDNVTFETSRFYRPEMNRYDLCISSMAGCLLGCKICQCTYANTGYERNLTSSEIVDQIEFLLDDGKHFIDDKTMVLVGFMGNGDPFHNIKEVLEAIRLTHRKYQKTIYRYGISTVGVNLDSVEHIAELILREDVVIWLQYSMISMNDVVRKTILPSSVSIIESTPYLDWFAAKTGYPVRYNFPMIEGVNDTTDHLDQIASFVKDKPQYRMVKLSNYNGISNKEYRPCSDIVIKESAEYLRNIGVKVDIFIGNRDKELRGSCGQLREMPLIIRKATLSVEDKTKPKVALYSHNSNKICSAHTVAKRFDVDISPIEQLSSSVFDHLEKERLTYLDQALLKARRGNELTKLPCIATDCGMEIQALTRKLGIDSKNVANTTSDNDILNAAIDTVSNLPPSERASEFVCVGVIMIDENHYLYCREIDSGVLMTSPRGPIIKGHPLASLLYIPHKNKTLAELIHEEYESNDVRIYNNLIEQFTGILNCKKRSLFDF